MKNSPLFVALLLVLVGSGNAKAQPQPVAAAAANGAQSAAPLDESAKPRSYSKYSLKPYLINVHLDVGVEPHSVGNAIAFGLGGSILWRGTFGVALGLYASEGAPVVVPQGSSGLADRVTATAALAFRLAPLVWKRGDSWLTRFVTGIGVEVGPSLEYFRTSALLIPGCDIPDQAYKAGLHAGLSLEIPVLGNASTGWLALRAAGRITLASSTELAPKLNQDKSACVAQITEPALIGQAFLGLSFYR